MSNPYAAPQFSPEPTPMQPAPQKKKKGGCLKWGAGAVAVFVLGGIALNAGSDSDDPTNTAAPEPSTSITAAESLESALSTPTLDINKAVADVETAEDGTGSDNNAVPAEHKNALRAAKRYLDFSSFSEAKLYDQLTSEYGSQFSPEAAQYAIDQLDVDWNAEALESAESYLDFSPFSKAKLYDQLTSEYGEKFTPEQAQYAVDTVNADWMAEAVEAAESYQELMPMSGPALLEQLTSEYGEQFTMEEAQHAVSTLGL
ncbi:MAG TPA: Ltp family lipoprotein [Candidatus Corynebacterium faecipullorum]|nr:Ltp family lipoprotein [Candidatus Corynebacterium faecipullorum]